MQLTILVLKFPLQVSKKIEQIIELSSPLEIGNTNKFLFILFFSISSL